MKMIYSLKYVPHPIERVNQVVYEFLQNSVEDVDYSRSLFPSWFEEVLNNTRTFEQKFIDVFDEFQSLDRGIRQGIFNLFDEGLDVFSICNDVAKPVLHTSNYTANLHENLKILLKDHFWPSLKTNGTIESQLDTSLNDHYIEFKKANNLGKICPFCGIHGYSVQEGEAKDSYDHWLAKSDYPLYAINFANLVPMCDNCNRTGVKGDTDMLYDSTTNNRRKAYYPYQTVSGINVEVDSYTPFENLDEERSKKFSYGYFNLRISAINTNEADEVETWKDVFNIQSRYNSHVSEEVYALKNEFHTVFLVSNPHHVISRDLSILRQIVMNFKSHLGGSIYRRPAMLAENAYLDFLCQQGNEYLLYTFCEVNVTI